MKFLKMQANGNDFIIVEKEPVENPSTVAKSLCRRRFSIGADGLVLLSSSEIADVRMQIFNPDGSEAEFCGNASRCVARYLYDSCGKDAIKIDTLSGIKIARIERGYPFLCEVEMGKPKFKPEQIPLLSDNFFFKHVFEEREHTVYCTNTAVPHAIIFVNSEDEISIELARSIRYSDLFPEGTNVDFVVIRGEDIYLRTYERGVENFTLSCGTGATATFAVGKKLGIFKDNAHIITDGGDLWIRAERDILYMKGGAEYCYRGEVDL